MAPVNSWQPQAFYKQPQALYKQPQALYWQPQALYWQPQAFTLCSTPHCLELFAQRRSIDPDRALPVSPSAWQHLHQSTLAASPTASCDQPWWLDLQSMLDKDGNAIPDQHRALFYVPPQLPCFAGHFPGQPILPGVVQLEWAMALADRLWPQTLAAANFAGMSRVKFKAPIEPSAVLAMELKLTDSAKAKSTTLTITSADQVLTSARLLYRD